MTKVTHISQNKKNLIRGFHASLARAGMMAQKPAILESFGVESTRDLNEEELQQVIDQMTGTADKWRKRVIAAVFGWCKSINLVYDVKTVIGIANRAAGYKDFNKIPVSRLRDVYYEFVKKNRVTVGAATEKEGMINYLENRN